MRIPTEIIKIIKTFLLILFLLFAVLNVINFYLLNNLVIKIVAYSGGAVTIVIYAVLYWIQNRTVDKNLKESNEVTLQKKETDSFQQQSKKAAIDKKDNIDKI